MSDTNERGKFEVWCSGWLANVLPPHTQFRETAWQGWKARAALAQPQAAQPARVWDEFGRTNAGDETGGAVQRFGFDISGSKPDIIPATNGAFVWYSDYLALHRKLATPPTQPGPKMPEWPSKPVKPQSIREAFKAWRESSPEPAAVGELPPLTVTEAMVTAYLTANDAYWKRIDGEPTKLGKWRNGTPSEATRVSLEAALASAPHAREPLTEAEIDKIGNETAVGAPTPAKWSQDFARAIERAHGIG